METLIARYERKIEKLKEELKSIGSLNKRWFIEEQIDIFNTFIVELKEEHAKCACQKAPVKMATPEIKQPPLDDREEFFKRIVPKKVCDGNSCTFVYEEDK